VLGSIDYSILEKEAHNLKQGVWFCAVASDMCESSTWNLLHGAHLVPGILKLLLGF